MCIIRKYDGPRGLPIEVADPASTGTFCVINTQDPFPSDLKSVRVPSPAAHDSDYNMHSHDEEQPRRHRGRPVKYLGDPNEPGLDAEERRQLLRRIANRESARRMRKRHLEELHHLSTEAKALQDNCDALTKELDVLRLKYRQAEEENRRISEELRIKKEKAEMWQTKNASLQREMCELTARMYEEKERSLCLELCLKEMEQMEQRLGRRGGAFAGPGPCNQAPGMPSETLGADFGAAHLPILPETTQQNQALPKDFWLKKMAAPIASVKTEAGQNPMQCTSPPPPLAGLAGTQSIPAGSDSCLLFQAPKPTGSFMGPSADNYDAAWSSVYDDNGAEGEQPPARAPGMTGLGRAHSEPISSGSAPSAHSDMQFGFFPEVAGDVSAIVSLLQPGPGETEESLDDIIHRLGLLPEEALLEPMSA